jgi:tetratricopeptide (TPR) repeat protein
MTGIEARLDAALAHHLAGQFEAARQGYLQILAEDGREHRALNLLGVLALDAGRADLAVDLIGRAIALADGAATYHNNLGNALRAVGRHGEAISAFRAALARMPDHPDMLINLGAALADIGDADAAPALWRALVLAPDSADGWFALAARDGAAETCRRALRFDPNRSAGWFNLANAIRALPGPAAPDGYRRALVLAPDDSGAATNFGALLRARGRSVEAVGALDRALRLAPDSADAHWNRGWARAVRGEFPAAWDDLEWRLRLPALGAPAVAPELPVWTGQPLAGRRLLLHAEQGLGDAVQFVRYVPLLAREAAAVSVVCHGPLAPLVRATWPDVEVRTFGEPPPAADLRLPLMSVAAVRRASLDEIPSGVPYLRASPERVAAWRDRVGAEGPRVGLCWRGNWQNREGRHRAVPPDALSPLARLPSLGWFDLTLDRDGETPGWPLIDLSTGLTDLGETAAALACLDLIITIDTSVAHLAGALGRPTWVMLAHAADWRWLEQRADSPWYPTLRLFRQRVAGDWSDVIEAVAGALRGRYPPV